MPSPNVNIPLLSSVSLPMDRPKRLFTPLRVAPRSGKVWPVLLIIIVAAAGTVVFLSRQPSSESSQTTSAPVSTTRVETGGEGLPSSTASASTSIDPPQEKRTARDVDAGSHEDSFSSASRSSSSSRQQSDVEEAPLAEPTSPHSPLPLAEPLSPNEPGHTESVLALTEDNDVTEASSESTSRPTRTSTTQTVSATTTREADGKTSPAAFAKDWPVPAFALAITGQQHGYIEPCGCSPKQSGGLARRADLLRQLRQGRKWTVLALDSGGTLDESRVTRYQSLLKFRMIQDAFNAMEYRTLGLGTEELKLGAIKLFEIFSTRNVQEGFDLPFVAANVVLLGSTELGTPSPFRVISIGGKKVAVTSVFGNEFKKELSLISEDELTISDPVQSLPGVIDSMQAEKPDLMVLLSYDGTEGSRTLAEKFPEFQVVVSAGGADDPGDEHEMIGQTLFFVSGMKGKYVNLVGVYPGQKPALRFERVELDQDRFQRAPKMREMMAEYQAMLKEQWLDPASEIRGLTFPHESGYQFVGAKACQECHASAYETWEGSEHANATASLREGRPEEKGEWIDRTWDPECLCCHATGWNASEAFPYSDGFIDQMTTPHLNGNQCENCHGPASEHVKLETDWKKSGGPLSDALLASRKFVTVSKAQAEKKVCLSCHDFANSPTFDFEEYWSQIEHPTPDSEKQK